MYPTIPPCYCQSCYRYSCYQNTTDTVSNAVFTPPSHPPPMFPGVEVTLYPTREANYSAQNIGEVIVEKPLFSLKHPILCDQGQCGCSLCLLDMKILAVNAKAPAELGGESRRNCRFRWKTRAMYPSPQARRFST